jgi:GAF domain-containing protein
MSKPAEGSAETEISAEIIRGIFERRLAPAVVEQLLAGLPDAGKVQLLLRIAVVARRNAVLVDVANRVSDTLSLDAERSSLFLHNAETGELFSRVMQGNTVGEVRFPAGQGIAGSVFTSGAGEIIPDAYADPRFNQAVVRDTGYRTRNILCMLIATRGGNKVGVMEILNKKGGGEFRAFAAVDDRDLMTGFTQIPGHRNARDPAPRTTMFIGLRYGRFQGVLKNIH